MSTQYGEAKTTPARQRDRTPQEAGSVRDRDGEVVRRSPTKDEDGAELYNLPFTD